MKNEMPLKGVKVVDLTIYVAAPAGTSLLGYMGADVIKVEPLKGDPYRANGAGFGMVAAPEENALFDASNCSKRCIAVDFRSEEGKEIIRKLIKEADIFVTNYRENALEGMGFTYENVIKVNPKIVYAKAGGYGDKGPDAARPGFDATAFFAKSGFASAGAYSDGAPMNTPNAAGDTITSMALAVGILGAYVSAKKSGKAEKVTTSLYESALWVLGANIARSAYDPIQYATREHPGFIPISHDYRCKDGVWVRFCGMLPERYWGAFCNALGLEEYVNDERFTTSVSMHEHAEEGYRLMQDKVALKNWAEWEPIFVQYDLPYEKVYTPIESCNCEQARANDYVHDVVYSTGKTVTLPMPPFQFENCEMAPKTVGPKLGEHTVEVLKEYGYSQQEIQTMLDERKIIQY